jgi:hypothetical protein
MEIKFKITVASEQQVTIEYSCPENTFNTFTLSVDPAYIDFKDPVTWIGQYGADFIQRQEAAKEKIKKNGSFLASMVNVEQKITVPPMRNINNGEYFNDMKAIIVETLKEMGITK